MHDYMHLAVFEINKNQSRENSQLDHTFCQHLPISLEQLGKAVQHIQDTHSEA